jgi:hypothetical protein
VSNVKKIELTMSVFAALLMVSAVANAEDQYPAANFEPKVVYQDESASSSSSSNSSSTTSSSSSSSSSGSDLEYPAANFQPKVVFEDKEYKHKDIAPNSSSNADYSTGSSASAATSSTPDAAKKDESSAGYLLGLLVLCIAGFVLFKKGIVGSAQTGKTVRTANASGITGVAKYLLKTSGTGVSRYLEKNAANAPAGKTGVAKYLASKGQSSGSTADASRAATGVEKYMRNKG